ncbi:MAG: NAD(+)/NADH kinase [Bacteroidales bacterium]|nr:NAD(+)/NADH kinase [Bacteroidales bacterium]
MKLALYSRQRGKEEQQYIDTVVEHLQQQVFDLLLHENCCPDGSPHAIFRSHDDLARLGPVDCMVSIGGDGSFIDAANLVGDLNIPLVGINTGRIGFLSGIKKENFRECFQLLQEGKYTTEERFLLHVDSSTPIESIRNHFVVNDLTIRTTDTDTIIAVTVRAGGQTVNTYWGDGLIISTPTGSTAYSMSCGGPILHPHSQVMVLTPIASHSLNVRPLVIPADTPLEIEVQSRSGHYSLNLDSQKFIVEEKILLSVTKENFCIRTLSFEHTDFYEVIREKLLWGLDKRNR